MELLAIKKTQQSTNGVFFGKNKNRRFDNGVNKSEQLPKRPAVKMKSENRCFLKKTMGKTMN